MTIMAAVQFTSGVLVENPVLRAQSVPTQHIIGSKNVNQNTHMYPLTHTHVRTPHLLPGIPDFLNTSIHLPTPNFTSSASWAILLFRSFVMVPWQVHTVSIIHHVREGTRDENDASRGRSAEPFCSHGHDNRASASRGDTDAKNVRQEENSACKSDSGARGGGEGGRVFRLSWLPCTPVDVTNEREKERQRQRERERERDR